jgi:hypothetical protein
MWVVWGVCAFAAPHLRETKQNARVFRHVRWWPCAQANELSVAASVHALGSSLHWAPLYLMLCTRPRTTHTADRVPHSKLTEQNVCNAWPRPQHLPSPHHGLAHNTSHLPISDSPTPNLPQLCTFQYDLRTHVLLKCACEVVYVCGQELVHTNRHRMCQRGNYHG